ncbi:S-adenosyl-L-methionine-dependent methyltransferase [Sistotremastrum suecicum HHB10207 ss-3]|uniref:tRNA (cytosine(38)-C(5))-methyltransferase n=1 Tax=Sistotremastrum suecicum HHB10207 ss-3 TaxID=1314776 RepID=A0A166HIT4_9AGAM|nr:S-adenosyl-L-methionine-dependent methyltransferase [Sistotremastrum suecicum HHB10207 ss-3]
MITALEFYSGIGGLHLALRRCSARGRVLRAFDWDQLSCQIYDANFGPKIAYKADISLLTPADLLAYRASLWLLSPSCQPYTVLNRNAKGAADPRAKSFLHIIHDVLPELVNLDGHPRYILVENVAGFETSETRLELVNVLHSLNYITEEFLLTPMQFGIPNSRLRYYLLARHSDASLTSSPSLTVLREIPGRLTLQESAIREIRDYLDPPLDLPEESLEIPDRILQKWGRLFDIVSPSSRKSCCVTRGYTHLVEGSGSILQMNENLDTTETFDSFLSSSEPDVSILNPLRLRYFSPAELLRLFSFIDPDDPHGSFAWPPSVGRKSKYRFIGNSVNVTVVTELLNYLLQDYS